MRKFRPRIKFKVDGVDFAGIEDVAELVGVTSGRIQALKPMKMEVINGNKVIRLDPINKLTKPTTPRIRDGKIENMRTGIVYDSIKDLAKVTFKSVDYIKSVMMNKQSFELDGITYRRLGGCEKMFKPIVKEQPKETKEVSVVKETPVNTTVKTNDLVTSLTELLTSEIKANNIANAQVLLDTIKVLNK